MKGTDKTIVCTIRIDKRIIATLLQYYAAKEIDIRNRNSLINKALEDLIKHLEKDKGIERIEDIGNAEYYLKKVSNVSIRLENDDNKTIDLGVKKKSFVKAEQLLEGIEDEDIRNR